MTGRIRISVVLLMILVLSISLFFVGHMAGDRTPEAYAALTNDEIDLCQLLSTPIGSNTVDQAAFLECIATLNQD
jgi:hypothetical protein